MKGCSIQSMFGSFTPYNCIRVYLLICCVTHLHAIVEEFANRSDAAVTSLELRQPPPGILNVFWVHEDIRPRAAKGLHHKRG